MIQLSKTVSFDESLSYEAQPREVQTEVQKILATKPTQQQSDDCGAGLLRPVRLVWALPKAEVVSITQYQHPPESAACFAVSSYTIILRPRLV